MSMALCLKGQFRMILKIILKKKEKSNKQQASSKNKA